MEAVMLENNQTAVWTKIIAAVLHYQHTHHGLSPTDEMIAIESGLSRDVVRSQMRIMEQQELLTDSKRWPRIIKINRGHTIDALLDKIDPKQKPVLRVVPKEEVKMEALNNSKHPKGKRYKRRYPFLEAAKKFAQALVNFQDEHGRSPHLYEISKELGYGGPTGLNTGGLSRVLRKMAEQGWVHHTPRHQRDIVLTSLGRAMLFGVNGEVLHTDMPVIPTDAGKAILEQAAPRVPHVEVRRAQAPTPMVDVSRAPTLAEEVAANPENYRPLQFNDKVEAPSAPTSFDQEIEAMRAISVALEPLSRQARQRVLTWVRDRLAM
jgi:hypothetical protein